MKTYRERFHAESVCKISENKKWLLLSFFIMNTAIFSVAAFPMTAGQCRRKSLRKPLLFFPSANMKPSPICSIPAAKDSFIWHPLPILPVGSTAPCEMASLLPTAQGFSLLPTKEAFHIIYHLPTEATGVDSLVYSVFRNGQWEKPYQIDRFLPLKQTPFLARRLSDAHIILYYRTGRNVLSAREMLLTPYTIGSVTPLIQTPTPCTDLSIINDTRKNPYSLYCPQYVPHAGGLSI